MIGNSGGLKIHKFLTAKKGSSPFECEDAIAFNVDRMVFSVADGATESYDSRSWARLLARSLVLVDPPPFEMPDFAPLVRDLGRRLQRKWSRRTLPWYAEEKAQGGSFAAVVALQLQAADTGLQWKAVAIGDCCLIHRDRSTLSEAFPLTRSEDFGSNPILLPSGESKQNHALQWVRHTAGTASPGHDFLLLSDAVGSWFLRQHEKGAAETTRSFDKLTESDDSVGLLEFFDELRTTGEIRNDDIAILRVIIC